MKKEEIICKECGIQLNSLRGLCNHLKKHKLNVKEYYDKWFKGVDENICKICGNETRFYSYHNGYRNTCSKICANEYRFTQIKKTFKNKYGSEMPFSIKEIIKKSENTRLRLYGHKNSAHGSNEIKVKKTMKERYGVEYYGGSEQHKNEMKELWKNVYTIEKINKIKEKKENTCIEKYGFKSMLCDQKIKDDGMLKKYGVKSSMHNKDSFDKSQKSAIKLKQFRNTNIWYQGSYEFDFLEKYYTKYPDITRGPIIKYNFNGNNKIHYPDFYIPSLNLIIECKSSWLYKRDKKIINIKKRAIIENGYKWKIIIDKNYGTTSTL